MKKYILLSVLLTGCNAPAPSFTPFANSTANPAVSPQLQRFSASSMDTARKGFATAQKAVKEVDPQAQLFEIDVWQEPAGKSLHYGFLPSQADGTSAWKVIMDVKTQQVKVERGHQGTQKNLVNLPQWKMDSDAIYAHAQKNGLRDTYYLATLWEDTWHISGLKQHLYFQMNARNGAIKFRCIGPYLNSCTDANGEPVGALSQAGNQQGFQKHLNARQQGR